LPSGSAGRQQRLTWGAFLLFFSMGRLRNVRISSGSRPVIWFRGEGGSTRCARMPFCR
jgi:hypothetical protein